VRKQTSAEIEIIVVDDASTDKTSETISDLCRVEPRLRYFRNEQPLGGGGARNAGADQAQGEFISFLDDDDTFYSHKLSIQISALRKHTTSPAASSAFVVYQGKAKSRTVRPISPRVRDELLQANVLGGASVCIVRSTAFAEVGGFDSRLTSCQDWDLWLKLSRLGPIVVCSEPLVRYNFHQGEQITGNVYAEYCGRRNIHIKYKKEMSTIVRRKSLITLIYYRRIRIKTHKNYLFRNIKYIFKFLKWNEYAPFVMRLILMFLRGNLFK
jgi:glycosyltransferase involved in cell wall biosynthesis